MNKPFSLQKSRGRVTIFGGDGEREDNPAGDTEQEQDSQDGGEQQDSASDDDTGDAAQSGGDDGGDAGDSLEAQLDAERRKNLKLQKELNKHNKDKEQAEADKDAAKDRDKYKTKLEARDKFLTDNLLLMEINKQKKYDFIDVDDVIRLLRDTEEVSIDLDADIPSIDGLDLALKRIAKDKPHWLKKAKEDKEEEQLPPSGSHPGGKTDNQVTEDQMLGVKYKLPGYGSQFSKPM